MTQNRANFNRKTARFRRRKCAQRTTKARRVNAHALHAFWQTVGTSAQLREALGGCRAPKPRRFSSKFSRFSPKIASFGRSMCCKKHRRARKKLHILFSMHQMIVHMFFDATNVRQCPQLRGFSKIFTQSRAIFICKIARFLCRDCAQRARKARRVNAHALHTSDAADELSRHLRGGLVRSIPPNPRRLSSDFSRFSQKTERLSWSIDR